MYLITEVTQVAGIGKKYSLVDGEIVKDHTPIYDALAVVRAVPDAPAMQLLMEQTAKHTDRALIAWYPKGLEGGETFRVLSRKKVTELYGPAGAAQVDVVHRPDKGLPFVMRIASDLWQPGGWLPFDVDQKPYFPAHWKDLSPQQWGELMAADDYGFAVAPGLDTAAKVAMPSSSSRVLRDGQPLKPGGMRIWVQLQDPAKQKQIGKRLDEAAKAGGLIKKLPDLRVYGLFDPAAFNRTQPVFDGAPMIDGTGLELVEAEPIIVGEGKWNSDKVRGAEVPRVRERVEEIFGVKYQRPGGGRGPLEPIANQLIPLDFEFELSDGSGTITLREHAELPADQSHVRVHVPDLVRPGSGGDNGILNKFRDGTSFFCDNGTGIKYKPEPEFEDHGPLPTGPRLVVSNTAEDLGEDPEPATVRLTSLSDGEPKTLEQLRVTPMAWEGDPPELEWVLGDVFPKGKCAAVGGIGGVGKSTMMQATATHIATGRPWAGLSVMKGPVMYISLEDDYNELWRRHMKICAGMMADPREACFEDLHFYPALGETVQLVTVQDNILDATERLTELNAEITRIQPTAIFLDVIPDFWNGNENDRQLVNSFVKSVLGRIAIEHDCAVIFLYHPSRTGAKDGTGESGSTSWNGSVRARVFIDDTAEEGQEPCIRFRVIKSNYGKKFTKHFEYNNGYHIETAEPGDPEKAKLTAHRHEILDALASGRFLKTGETYPISQPLLMDRMAGEDFLSKTTAQRRFGLLPESEDPTEGFIVTNSDGRRVYFWRKKARLSASSKSETWLIHQTELVNK